MPWILVLELLYFAVLLAVVLHIINFIKNNSKALAYILLVIFLPFIGFAIYFVFGFNFHKIKIFRQKLSANENLRKELFSDSNLHNSSFVESLPQGQRKVAKLILSHDQSPLTTDNEVALLVNGEAKFPSLLEALQSAVSHIHMMYYIYRDDETGRSIEKILIQKVQQGVEVRVIYDDLGSLALGKTLAPRLRDAGVQVYPYEEIKFMLLANRYNYRNHRKIVIIDGHTSYVGGINVGNEYVNKEQLSNDQFWRDSHLKISGSAVYQLQYLFMADWNHCCTAEHLVQNSKDYMPTIPEELRGKSAVQIVSSGPDSAQPSVEHSIIQAINGATKEVLITTPYFVPSPAVLESMIIAASSGVKVQLLVPDKGDSMLVDAASEFYYDHILSAGVEIYLYTKGFIHAKTLIVDESLCILGTANIDIRSFDLNFEVNTVIYDAEVALKMKSAFLEDLQDSEVVDPERWARRSMLLRLRQNVMRLLSPIL